MIIVLGNVFDLLNTYSDRTQEYPNTGYAYMDLLKNYLFWTSGNDSIAKYMNLA